MPSQLPTFFGALLRSAYFPKELPPAITTRLFSQFCTQNYSALKATKPSLTRRTTNYDTFTAPRASGGRRNLAVVHPMPQIALSLHLAQHRSRVKSIVGKNGISFYGIEEDIPNNKAFSGIDFDLWREKKSEICSQSKYVLHADISRYFYTAYTHSLPWAVIGKSKVKDWLATSKHKKLKAHWSNDLDVIVQSSQSRETFGIPVGPDTSRLLAEILISGVEADPELAKIIAKQPAARLVDDYFIGFDSIDDANRALEVLRSALWKYNLQLNDEKTGVQATASIFEDVWKLELRAFHLSNRNHRQQFEDIDRLRDLALALCEKHGSAAPVHFVAGKLNVTRIFAQNFPLVMETYLRFTRDYPSAIPFFSSFVINNRDNFSEPGRKAKIEIWILKFIRDHLRSGHDLEVSWALVIAGVLRIRVSDAVIESFDVVPGSIVFVLFGLLRERGLLGFPLSRWSWRAETKKLGIYSESWLPYYESVRRGWTKDSQMISTLNSEPVFRDMLTKNVTFLEDRLFDARVISLKRRVFKSESQEDTGEDEIDIAVDNHHFVAEHVVGEYNI